MHLSNIYSSHTYKDFCHILNGGTKVVCAHSGALIFNTWGLTHFMVYLQENIEKILTEYCFQNDWTFARHSNTPTCDLKLTSKKVCNNYIATKNTLSCIITFDMILDVLTVSVFITHSCLALCVWETKSLILTANHHHSNSKDLLPIGSWSNVPKSNTGEAGHRKIQRGDVHRIFAWSTFPFSKARCVKAIRCSYWHPQLIEPALMSDGVCILINNFIVSYAVPNAGQPVCCKTKYTHQQNQDCCSIFNVVVQLPSYATQPK